MRRIFLFTARIRVFGLLLYFAVRGIPSTTSGRAQLEPTRHGCQLDVARNSGQFDPGLCRRNAMEGDFRAARRFARPDAGLSLQHDRHVLQPDPAVDDWRRRHATLACQTHRRGLAVASLPWSYELIANTHGRLALVAVDIAAISAGGGLLLLGALRWPWLKTWWPTHHIHACAVIADRLLFSRATGPKIAALSITIHVLTVVISWCVVRSILAPAQFERMFLLVPPVALITTLPGRVCGSDRQFRMVGSEMARNAAGVGCLVERGLAKPIENVSTGRDDCLCSNSTMVEESMPPDRNEPTGHLTATTLALAVGKRLTISSLDRANKPFNERLATCIQRGREDLLQPFDFSCTAFELREIVFPIFRSQERSMTLDRCTELPIGEKPYFFAAKHLGQFVIDHFCQTSVSERFVCQNRTTISRSNRFGGIHVAHSGNSSIDVAKVALYRNVMFFRTD
jgi:hypothetical protein